MHVEIPVFAYIRPQMINVFFFGAYITYFITGISLKRMKVYLKIALVYTAICAAYILISDSLLLALGMSTEQLSGIQTVKGMIFVLLSGCVIYFLVRYYIKKLEKSRDLLRRTIATHELIFEQNPFPSFIMNADNLKYLKVNHAAEVKFGHDKAYFLGTSAYEMIINLGREDLDGVKKRIQESGYTELMVDGINKKGQVIHLHLFCQPLLYNKVQSIIAIAVDVSFSRLEKQVFMDQLVDSLEEERSRIAGHIHDSIKQCFGMIQGMLNSLDVDLRKNKLIESALKFTDFGLNESRRISHTIAPGFGGMELISSLEHLTENLNAISDIRFELKTHIEKIPSDDIALNLYRIIQEGTNNVMTHSRTDKALIQLIENNNNYELDIVDWGIGMSNKGMPENMESLGMNLIRSRATKLDGTFELYSEPNKGTKIRITVPVKEKTLQLVNQI